jgi:pyruvate,orthophosphate dikinase
MSVHLQQLEKKMNNGKLVYLFNEGNAEMKSLLGGKGANLAEMKILNLPVPPGFIITTAACRTYYEADKQFPSGLVEQIDSGVTRLEEESGRKVGMLPDPLFLSVRSGAPVSMPGMMDTILNLGMNDTIVEGMLKAGFDERFVYDCYRRLLQMFGDVVLKVEHAEFEKILSSRKEKQKVQLDIELTGEDLKAVTEEFKELISSRSELPFPEDPREQLIQAVDAVFNSWDNPRAQAYRRENGIADDLFTAVNIQVMVYGNKNQNSYSGVAFTRNPANGDNKIYGEFLQNAQGEDVVAGTRTPHSIDMLKDEKADMHEELERECRILEAHYKDMQDIEFTIEDDTFYILQTRTGKRTAAAAVKIAVDLVREGILITDEAVRRIDPDSLDQLLHKTIDPDFSDVPDTEGLPASPGAASGHVVFSVEEARRRGLLGEDIILVRVETTPEDIEGVFRSAGILTSQGGMTSHAAVVTRSLGKPCVAGCGEVKIDYKSSLFTIGDQVINHNDIVTIDGTSGKVYLKRVPMVEPQVSSEFNVLLSWADQISKLRVRANVNTPEEARQAIKFHAEGIGLCRTERMFNRSDRLPIVQKMILAKDGEERKEHLNKLLPMQIDDFSNIFKVMHPWPVTIRLLDPPLHEFLPSVEDLLVKIQQLRNHNGSKEDISSTERLMERVKELQEVNPMLGHRGVRLGLAYPEIYRMQVQAIFEAVVRCVEDGITIEPEIMIPQVCTAKELVWAKALIKEVADEIWNKWHHRIKYKFGSMIEVVRACMRAGRLAEVTDFFSFGTNDLSQSTFSFSREDAENKFLPLYNERGILQDNPFKVLDIKGVGRLMMITVEWGRRTNPDLKIGICGEHGGHPYSINLCHGIGLDYVSCSPFRVPIAKIAAAQATLRRA